MQCGSPRCWCASSVSHQRSHACRLQVPRVRASASSWTSHRHRHHGTTTTPGKLAGIHGLAAAARRRVGRDRANAPPCPRGSDLHRPRKSHHHYHAGGIWSRIGALSWADVAGPPCSSSHGRREQPGLIHGQQRCGVRFCFPDKLLWKGSSPHPLRMPFLSASISDEKREE